MELRPATQSDIDYVSMNPADDNVKTYPRMTNIGDCVTGTHNGIIWGLGGLVIHYEGMGEFWLILTKDFNGNVTGHAVLKQIMLFVEDRINEHELFRAQAVIRTDFAEAIEMIEFLGFECEGVMKQYLPGPRDAYMYAKIGGI